MTSRRSLAIAFSLALIARGSFAAELIPEMYLAPRYIAPRNAPSQIVIAGKDEPGQRMIVTGQVTDGKSPLAGVSLFVFHTDAEGKYANKGRDLDQNARLAGAMRTDKKGQFRYDTIRPHGYGPDSAAHVHYVVRARGFKPHMEELRFTDDPNGMDGLADQRIADKTAAGYLAKGLTQYLFVIRPVTRDAQGVEHVIHNIVLERD